MSRKWTDLTAPQQRVLLDCERTGLYQVGRQFNTCRNLLDMGLLSVFSLSTYELTDEGRKLAEIGRGYKPEESRKARIERLYAEAIRKEQ